MSTSNGDSESVVETLRTVTPLSTDSPDTQMNFFGYMVAAPIFVILLPLLPFVVAGWLVSKGLGALRGS
ncbi:hypothetical protein Hrd1104_11305 [Halorhabdus sp. CBA1104]|uniref:DUF7535 family protein n=1 Tax=unclassified Halorhabdus TaxID=2621901 RepID=UPI0012B35105|nr:MULTISPECIES: hypothetical protein [unclassified Halorhabdus]QGN07831.1 hypothetical protein Hrd1104_11305 [Halorhabdus sp. CBA1104]